MTSSERKLLLGTDSNSNVHSWRDNLTQRLRINWRSNKNGKNCINSLQVDKNLHHSVKKINGQRFIVQLTLTDSNEYQKSKIKIEEENAERSDEKKEFVAPKMMLKISLVEPVGSKRYLGIFSVEEILKIISYKSTWQKMVDTMEKDVNGIENSQEEVKTMIQNARSEWAVYPDPTASEESKDTMGLTQLVNANEREFVQSLTVKNNLIHICNQLQDVLIPLPGLDGIITQITVFSTAYHKCLITT